MCSLSFVHNTDGVIIFLFILSVFLNSVHKELFAKIDKLSVNNPSINLMKEYFVALKNDPCEHSVDNWVPSDTSSVE